MTIIHCARACAHLASPPELLTAGMAKAVTVEFEFTEDWDGLAKTAVFTNGTVTVDVLQSNWQGNTVTIPAEVLTTAGRYVRVGVYGSNADGVALPTIWADLGKVRPGAEPSGDASTDPALPVWAQLQALIGDLDDLTTKAKDNLVAAINEAAKTGSGGSGSIDLRVADGYIQYSNDGGTTWQNLIAVADLKGEKGDTGAPGPQGEPGERGPQGETGPQGPQGQTGPTGPQGETGPAGPAGQDGAPGKDGSPGKDGTDGTNGKDGTTFTPSVSASGDLSWTNDGGKENPETVNIRGPQGPTGPAGPDGDTGATPNLQIGTVETLPAGSDATASMGGTAENPLLNLGIPKGADGSGGSPTITTATETDIAGLLMGEGGKVRKAVPDEDYLKTKELPTPVPSNDSGKYLRWFDVAGWHLESLDLYTCNVVDANGQYYCDQIPTDIQALVTAGKTIFAMSNGEPYLLTSLSAQAAVFTRVAGTTVTTITVSSDYTAALTTTELQPEIPVTAADNGKFLRVVNGAWAADTVPSAGGASF